MAASPAASGDTKLSFFGTCPCGWDSLTLDQKVSCTGISLSSRIECNFAWTVAGDLRDQWNDIGFHDYQAVIKAHRSCRRIHPPELRLLSNVDDQNTASPVVIITCTHEKAGKEAVSRLKQHPRLSRFGFPYVLRLSDIRITAGSASGETLATPSNLSLSIRGLRSPMKNICGARIAVYSGAVSFSSAQRKVATIGTVLKIGEKHYGLTVAHVFFESVNTEASWLDSGLSLNSRSDVTGEWSDSEPSSVPQPHVAQSYEIVIESLWPHVSELQSKSGILRSTIGRVSVGLMSERKGLENTSLPEVILDYQHDWALIELRNPLLWGSNDLTLSDRHKLTLCIPDHDIRPPTGEIVIAAGVSGEVRGEGMGTVGGIWLPWLTTELPTWSVESTIAVGDSGAVAVSPHNGVIYGMVAAHDPSVTTTFIIPLTIIVDDFMQKFQCIPYLPEGTDVDLSVPENVDLGLRCHVSEGIEAIEESIHPTRASFMSRLNDFSVRGSGGESFIMTQRLRDWLFESVAGEVTNLELLLKFVYSPLQSPLVRADEISTPGSASLLVLCLLVELKIGYLIHLFHNNGLTDGNLPFTNLQLVEVLNKTSIEPERRSQLISSVHSVQFKYCPIVLDLNMSLDLPTHSVIPTLQRQRINSKGTTAQMWEILISQDHVGTELRRMTSPISLPDLADKYGPVYHFALKTFTENHELHFRKEKEALRLFENNSNIVHSLGSFSTVYEGKVVHNLLFEYADLDLREYFAKVPPPSDPLDILAFWQNMHKIVDALHALHSGNVDKDERVGKIRCNHGDIKPDNILLIKNEFKLSDLGSTCFENEDGRDVVPRGTTYMYNCPEISFQESITSIDGQAADIWSLGCVLSEAAVWVVKGYSGFLQYSAKRQTALQSQPSEFLSQFSHAAQKSLYGIPCFHDGKNVLSAVIEVHQSVKDQIRTKDTITKQIVDLIESEILIAEPKDRCTASFLQEQLSKYTAEYRERILKDDFTAVSSQFGLCLSQAPTLEPGMFIGRSAELDQLAVLLCPDAKVVERRQVVLGGMGGIGKTQLAIAYARRHQASYSSVFWFNATSVLTLGENFKSVAREVLNQKAFQQLDNENLKQEVLRWLSDLQNTRWLLIFDNYDDPSDFSITDYLPHAGHGSVIVTTRLPYVVAGEQMRVGPMLDVNDGLSILRTRSQRPVTEDDYSGRRLVERLAGNPLALATAGAYLRKSTWTFNQYLDAYEKYFNVTQRRPLRLREYSDRTLYTTWNLSFQRIERDDPLAAKLLKQLAFFDNQEIWYWLLHAGVNEKSPTWVVEIFGSQISFESVVSTLVDFCFLELHTSKQSYCIHNCVHDWALNVLNSTLDPELYWFAFDCVANSIGDKDVDDFAQLRYGRLCRHGLRLNHSHFDDIGQDNGVLEKRADDMTRIIQLLANQGHLPAAEKMSERILQSMQSKLDPHHPSVLAVSNNLGLLYRDQGKLIEAERMLTQTIAGWKKVNGPNHSCTLTTINNLGLLYCDLGKLEEAEVMLVQALVGRERAFGPDHSSTLATVSNLGLLYYNQGKLTAAEQMLARALVGRERAFGPDHSLTLTTVSNLGLLYRSQGRLAAAEQMLARALAGRKRAFGPSHPSTLATINNLGFLYRDQGKPKLAEYMLKRALVWQEEKLGHDHPWTRITKNHLELLSHGKVRPGHVGQIASPYTVNRPRRPAAASK